MRRLVVLELVETGVFLECFHFLIEPLQQFGRAVPSAPDAHVHPLREEPMIIALSAGHRLAGPAELTSPNDDHPFDNGYAAIADVVYPASG